MGQKRHMYIEFLPCARHSDAWLLTNPVHPRDRQRKRERGVQITGLYK